MSLKHEFRRLLWKAGYDLIRFSRTSHPLARRKRLLAAFEINLVLDVGANTGQFAMQLRRDLGFRNQIISFEPLPAAFEQLDRRAKRDTGWTARRLALGDVDEIRKLHVAANSGSSSLLEMLPAHLRSAPDSKYVGEETVEVRRLDSIFTDISGRSDRVYLKIDTQGFEERVLAGAAESLPRIDTVQMEMSLIPLYDGETLLPELCRFMVGEGYRLVALEPGFSDPVDGHLLQVDGIFHRFPGGGASQGR